MSLKRRREQNKIKKIALERITILLTRADAIYKTDQELALRYGKLARKIAMKARVKIPSKWRLRFCRNCKNFLYPGITARVRLKKSTHSHLLYTCLLCNEHGKRVKVIKSLTEKNA
ncbi:MAG: ribonuclease P [Candidatus Heimdallarchaeota archaeon]|nr:ribonuclease P [Candidatus Heimdallarchaeota archaeon]